MATSPRLGPLTVIVFVAGVSGADAAVPLRILDTPARDVFVEIENSSSIDNVGQSYGPAFPATYSATGSVGTLVISAATHEAMYAGYIPAPVPGSFTPIVIEIDLATRHAESQVASGGFASGQLTGSFSQGVLRSDSVVGVIVSGVPPFTCASQAEVDNLCSFIPMFCGKTCSFVSGVAYDPANGKLNLVGSRTESGCDGGMCQGPFTYFTPRGDLRLSEPFAPAVPALAPWATTLLLAGFVTAVWMASRRAAQKDLGGAESRALPVHRAFRRSTTSRPPRSSPSS